MRRWNPCIHGKTKRNFSQILAEKLNNINMSGLLRNLLIGCLVLIICFMIKFEATEAAFPKDLLKMITKVNKLGPYIGLVVPTSSEMEPFLQLPIFRLADRHDHIDFAGRRFTVGHIGDRKLIIVVTGKGMINAAITTQLLCTMFNVKGVLHYGLGRNTDDKLNFGDITIPQNWAHTGLWNWERYGDGIDDEFSFNENGDFTKEYGYLNFADFMNKTEDENTRENFLNKIWYQPEEIFPIDGTSESQDRAFWIPVSHSFFEFGKTLLGMKLDECINGKTCLPKTPSVVPVKRGSSANIHLHNAAYKTFLNSKFEASVADMESAAVALISHQQKIPFISFRALSDFAGDDQEGSSMDSKETREFFKLLIENCIKVAVTFIKNMKDMPPDDVADVSSI